MSLLDDLLEGEIKQGTGRVEKVQTPVGSAKTSLDDFLAEGTGYTPTMTEAPSEITDKLFLEDKESEFKRILKESAARSMPGAALLPDKYGKSLITGVGSTAKFASGVLDFFDDSSVGQVVKAGMLVNPLNAAMAAGMIPARKALEELTSSDTFLEAGARVTERLGDFIHKEFKQKSSVTGDEGLAMITEPDFWLVDAPESIPTSAALMLGGAQLGGAAAGATWLSRAMASLAAGVGSRTLESAGEAGQVYQELLASGKGEAEAKAAADKTFAADMALAGIDAWQFASLFFGRKAKALPRGKVKVTWQKVLGAAKGLTDILFEGGEEIYQTRVSAWAKGEKKLFDPTLSTDEQKAGMLGAVMGTPFAVAAMMEKAELPPDLPPTLSSLLRMPLKHEGLQPEIKAAWDEKWAKLPAVLGDKYDAEQAGSVKRLWENLALRQEDPKGFLESFKGFDTGAGVNFSLGLFQAGMPAPVVPEFAEQDQRERSGLGMQLPHVLLSPTFNTKPDVKMPGKQMFATLGNFNLTGEMEYYKGQGLEQFLSEARTPREVATWMQEKAPKVKVHTFGTRGNVKEELNKLTHEWYDGLDSRMQDLIGKYERAYAESPVSADTKSWRNQIKDEFGTDQGNDARYEFTRNLDRFISLKLDEEVDGAIADQAHWSFVAPKAEKDMQGYVELAVSIPRKTIPSQGRLGINAPRNYGINGIGDTFIENPLFPSSHNFPPNTLAFVRGYMETLADGKKVFHVVEVQSDWGQKQRSDKELAAKNPQDKQYASEVAANDHPLLRDYSRLALKAAIQYARANGASAIAISDAETAMLTEGHDQGDQVRVVETDTGKIRSTQPSEKVAKEVYAPELASGKYKLEIGPTQEPGMRLNYDKILPSIAEELTGANGTRVELGMHKNVRDNSFSSEVPRKNLIFKNPDGTPKTSITAMMFPLAGARPNFTLFGKDKAIKRSNVLHQYMPKVSGMSLEDTERYRTALWMADQAGLQGMPDVRAGTGNKDSQEYKAWEAQLNAWKEIWEQTGWFMDRRGTWSMYLPEADYSINGISFAASKGGTVRHGIAKGTIAPLAEVLESEKLYELMPDLADVQVEIGNPGDGFAGVLVTPKLAVDKPKIIIHPDATWETIVHEVQHAIDYYSGRLYSPGHKTNAALEEEEVEVEGYDKLEELAERIKEYTGYRFDGFVGNFGVAWVDADGKRHVVLDSPELAKEIPFETREILERHSKTLRKVNSNRIIKQRRLRYANYRLDPVELLAWDTKRQMEKVAATGKPGVPLLDELLELTAEKEQVLTIPLEASKLMQAGRQSNSARGATSWTEDGKAIISLFSGADFSTLVHESVHVFTRYLTKAEATAVAKWAGQPVELLLKWQGDPNSLTADEFSRLEVLHERFAKGAEVYFRRGNAPTAASEPLFARFKKWLTDVYQSVKEIGLDIKLNKDVENIFASWVVSEQELRQEYGEIVNPATKKRYQIFKHPRLGKVVAVNRKGNTLYVPVTNLLDGKAPSNSQSEVLGVNLRWISPRELYQQMELNLNTDVGVVEAGLAELYHLDFPKLMQVAKQRGAVVPDWVKSREDLAYFLETEIRSDITLSMPNQYYLGHEAQSLVHSAWEALKVGNRSKAVRLVATQNPISKAATAFSYKAYEWLESWRTQLADLVAAYYGKDGESIRQKAFQAQDTAKKIIGLVQDDLETLLHLTNPYVKGTKKFSTKAKVEIADLLSYEWDKAHSFGMSKFRLAVEGHIPLDQLTALQKELVTRFIDLSRRVAEPFESGLLDGRIIGLGGTKIFDKNKEIPGAPGEKPKKGVWIKFQRAKDGRMQRQWTPEFIQMLAHDELKKLIARALVEANGLDPTSESQIASAFRQLSALHKSITKKNSMESLRTFAKIPDVLRINVHGITREVKLTHNDPYGAAISMVHRAADRYGFISQFHSFDNEAGVYNNDDTRFLSKLRKRLAKQNPGKLNHFDRLIQSLNGVPLWLNKSAEVGDITHMLEYFWRGVLNVYRAIKLPFAFIPNFFEPLGLTSSSFGWNNTLKGFAHAYFKDPTKHSELFRAVTNAGGRSLMAGKWYVDPTRRWADSTGVLQNILLAALKSVTTRSEALASVAAYEMVQDLKGRVGKDGKIRHRRLTFYNETLRLMGFTEEQRTRMMIGRGSDEEYSNVLRRAATTMFGTNARPSEIPALRHNPAWRAIVQFDGYFSHTLDKLTKKVGHIREDFRKGAGRKPGDNRPLSNEEFRKAVAEVKRTGSMDSFLREMGGRAGAGILASVFYILLRGGFGELEEEKKRASSLAGTVDFLFTAIFYNVFGGPVIGAMRQFNYGVTNPFEIAMGASAPLSSTMDLVQYATRQGIYKHEDITGGAWSYLKRNGSIFKRTDTIIAALGLGGRSLAKERALTSYYKWRHEHKVESAYAVLKNESAEHKAFSVAMANAAEQIQRGNIEDATEYISQALAGSPEKQISRSLRARKKLRGLSHEELESLKAYVTEESFAELVKYDQLLESWAEAYE